MDQDVKFLVLNKELTLGNFETVKKNWKIFGFKQEILLTGIFDRNEQ